MTGATRLGVATVGRTVAWVRRAVREPSDAMLIAAPTATPRAAPQMTSSGLWAPTYTRPIMTSATSTHGTGRHRGGRYGVITVASAATRMACPDTKLSPAVLTSPRTLMSGPIDVPGRSRVTVALTARSTTSLATVDEQRGERQLVAAQDERDDGDDRTDHERAQLLERPQHRVEDLRQVVDGAEQ